ncbi:enoyl-CoA hydratase-related protein [Psychrobium sp. 1_MG-2023]|uniref:enoyl-CoA hydratase-related protein n=1 Tax=Psychrobium sp. 1_MG-2023 TaxID=3062624 RepID=UPI000C324B13|nr:enoyl-CoA hydratase-related protein [Psychrobium sp. 1_MG-2023]MDP2559894.1 enoyl-CoA hydratase-related protein [Psychrobium sp. 1_MG-2023]PKF59005.1 gamma-carboxygeranoyl-CoA hydratase [Alteromonadales bacterium alter-6D02]
MTQPHQYVATNIDDRGIATITMLRQAVHNAFDDEMIAQLINAFETLSAEPKARVLILRSLGKNFSAGADLNWMRSMAKKNYQENLDDAGVLARLMQVIAQSPKPTIALVQGAAFGGAVGLVACCDIAVATNRASFCLSEVKIGLIPAVISPYVVAAIGRRQAQRYFLTAERFRAEQALQFGLVHHICDEEGDDALLNSAMPIVDALLANSPAAMTQAKELIHFVADKEINEATIHGTSERIAAIRVSEEGQEGLSSFLEKRSPRWLNKQD